MLAYAKKTLVAQRATNCVSDIMFQEALLIPPVANWGLGVDLDAGINEAARERSLLGVPVSIKGAEHPFKKWHATDVALNSNTLSCFFSHTQTQSIFKATIRPSATLKTLGNHWRPRRQSYVFCKMPARLYM